MKGNKSGISCDICYYFSTLSSTLQRLVSEAEMGVNKKLRVPYHIDKVLLS